MNTPIPVTVIVTVLNEAAVIDELLIALLNQSYQPTQIIIVDGGSTDETVSKLKKFQVDHPSFPLLLLIKVGNRSVGRNVGMQKAATKVVAITDAGCVPHVDWLEQLVTVYLESGNPVVAGYYDAAPRTKFETAVVPYALVMPDKINPKTFLPATRSMLLEKEVWSKLGGFNEKLSDNEDFEFAQQLKKNKLPIAFAPEAKVAWRPRSSLMSFITMIYRFARGDAFAGIWRPKVFLIFIRYLAGLAILSYFTFINESVLAINVVIVGLVLYGYWAIRKNFKYVKQGWYWLPVLQMTSDLAVMAGTLVGGFKHFFN